MAGLSSKVPLDSLVIMDQALTALAKLIGVEDLRSGRHILRNERGWRTGEVTVSYAWRVIVTPSFHDPCLLTVVRTVDTEFRGKTASGFLRAGIAIMSRETKGLRQAVAVDIDADPVFSAIGSVDLRASSDSLWLDGIGYELHTDFTPCRASLHFSNPTVQCFRNIEDSMLAVAGQVANASSESTISGCVKTWRGYLRDRQREA